MYESSDVDRSKARAVQPVRPPKHVSPTIFRSGLFRFYFFSREESRRHVHVQCADGEAKFRIEPSVELAMSTGMKKRRLAEVRRLIEEHLHDIRAAWQSHFG